MLLFLTRVAPVSLYGEGDYAMTVVQEVLPTQSFLALPEEVRRCEKTESLGDCLTRDYLARLQAGCSCLPHPLAGPGRAVCGPRDSECVASVSLNTGRCLVPCHGLYADVKESGQLRLKVDKQPEYELLVQEYENYKHFNEVEIQRSSIKGRHNRNLCTSFIHMINL